jgi:hypothetical protein
MTTFCILCRAEIPPDRQRRGACTCSSDHARELRRQRRAEHALRFCRLCGRKARKPKRAEPVRMGHSVEKTTGEPEEAQL